jgi:ribosomal-protein-alanine N-acetyltransferase
MHHQAVEISFMVTADLDEIISIENNSFSTPWSRNIFMQELQLKMSRNLVAKIPRNHSKEIAGYMTYWIIAGEMHIQRIATRKDLRRFGIASKLMEEVIRLSVENGCTQCILEVGRSNKSAITFYEKYGFTIRGVRPLYYSERGEDALMMEADLRECMRLIHHEP